MIILVPCVHEIGPFIPRSSVFIEMMRTICSKMHSYKQKNVWKKRVSYPVKNDHFFPSNKCLRRFDEKNEKSQWSSLRYIIYRLILEYNWFKVHEGIKPYKYVQKN